MHFVRNLIMACLAVFALSYLPVAHADFKETNSFIAVADIHFDPFHACKPNAPCPLVAELNQADASQWTKIFEKYDTGAVSTYDSDTNYPLLKSSLIAVNQQVVKTSPKFVLIVGDFIGHEYKDKYETYVHDNSPVDYQNFVKKTFQFLQQQMQKTFGNIPIYITIGNNDTYDGDYIMVPKGKFFNDMTSIWLPLLRKNTGTFKKTFPIAGYYSVTPASEPRLRIIVLNSILFMEQAKSPSTDEAAKKQLIWLKSQLNYAEKAKQKVLLVTHVPVGIDSFKTAKGSRGNIVSFWLPNYTKEFLKLIKQYQPVVSGMVSGHIHMDIFQVLKSGPNPVFNTSVPSISPVFGNNPGFKVYNYAPGSLMLQDYTTFYLDEGRSRPKWKLEYSFNNAYDSNCKTCDLITDSQKFNTDITKKYYSLSSEKVKFAKEHWLPYIWCGIKNITVNDYQTCLHN